jgi:hypothetical protein
MQNFEAEEIAASDCLGRQPAAPIKPPPAFSS